MTRITKIEELGMLDEIKRMRAEGMSEQSIADYVNTKHEDTKVSVMAIHRALEVVERKKIENQLQDGANPVDVFTKEFRDEIKKNTKEVKSVIAECKEMLKDAKKNGEIGDRIKAADVLLKGLTNERKNWESLQQFGTMRIDTINKKAFEQKEQVNNLLGTWITIIEGGLCPRCKQEVIPEVLKLIQLEKEEK